MFFLLFFFSAFNLTEHVLGRLVPLKEYRQKVSTPSTTDPPAAVAAVFILKQKILDFNVFFFSAVTGCMVRVRWLSHTFIHSAV